MNQIKKLVKEQLGVNDNKCEFKNIKIGKENRK